MRVWKRAIRVGLAVTLVGVAGFTAGCEEEGDEIFRALGSRSSTIWPGCLRATHGFDGDVHVHKYGPLTKVDVRGDSYSNTSWLCAGSAPATVVDHTVAVTVWSSGHFEVIDNGGADRVTTGTNSATFYWDVRGTRSAGQPFFANPKVRGFNLGLRIRVDTTLDGQADLVPTMSWTSPTIPNIVDSPPAVAWDGTLQDWAHPELGTIPCVRQPEGWACWRTEDYSQAFGIRVKYRADLADAEPKAAINGRHYHACIADGRDALCSWYTHDHHRYDVTGGSYLTGGWQGLLDTLEITVNGLSCAYGIYDAFKTGMVDPTACTF